MNELKIDSFIETRYYQAKEGNMPIDVIDFNMAFATNPYYKSGSPIARHGFADFMIDIPNRSDVDYSSEFADSLIETDRYIVTDRVAFFSIMRAYLPSFSLISKQGNEISVKSFASFYKDGFFSVTNLYSCKNMSFNKASLQRLYNWDDIAYIKMDVLTTSLLNIDCSKNETECKAPVEAYGISIEDFSRFFPDDKFSIGKETIFRVLEKHRGSIDRIDVGSFAQPYSYLVLRCNCSIKRINIQRIANILSAREDNEFVNEALCDMGTDLTAVPDTIMRGYRNFLFSVQKTELEITPNALVVMFSLFDSCIIEKLKYIIAMQGIRELIYYPNESQDEIKHLIELRQHQMTTVYDGYVYEYRDELSLTVKAIRNCLGIDDYKTEYEHFCHIADELIVKNRERIMHEEKSKQNKMLSILTLLLTIPSVIILVDAFYGLEINPPFNLPILSQNATEIIWCGIVLLVSLCTIYRRLVLKTAKKILNKCKNKENTKT